MADRRLKNIGTTQMGKSGTVKLSEIGRIGSSQSGNDGYDRTYVNAANDYKRMNPFEIANGKAPAPTGSGGGLPSPPYKLSNWGPSGASGEAYTQRMSSKDYAKPSDVDITDIVTPTAADNASFELSFTIPAGFTDFDTQGVDTDIFNRVYARICSDQGDGGSVGDAGSTGCSDVADEDPVDDINGGTTQNLDSSPITVTSLTQNTWYAIACRIEWDDTGVQSIGSFTNVSDMGTVKSSQTETCCNVTPDTGANRIFFKTPVWVCQVDSLGISTTNILDDEDPSEFGGRDETTDSRCEACYNYNVVSNRVTRYRGVTTDQIGNSSMNLYTNSTCTTEDTTTIWFSPDGDTAYKLGTSTSFDCQTNCAA